MPMLQKVLPKGQSFCTDGTGERRQAQVGTVHSCGNWLVTVWADDREAFILYMAERQVKWRLLVPYRYKELMLSTSYEEIAKHPANTSPTKQQFSFPKASRFPSPPSG